MSFMDLYHENYNPEIKQEKSLPYSVRISDIYLRKVLAELFVSSGFEFVNGNRGVKDNFTVMYFNFEFKRFGSGEQPCKSSAINDEVMEFEDFWNNVCVPYFQN